METRKLQRIGGSTYSVSLPKEWAKRHRLEAGMPIRLYPHSDGSLVVRCTERDGGPLARVELRAPRSDAAAIERTLRAGYAVGFDTVVLRPPEGGSFAPAQRRAARRFVQSLVGLSVVEETADRLVVENLLDASEVSIRQSVIQLQFTALSMHRSAVEALSTDAADTDRIEERDDEVDRLFEMVTRHFDRSLTDFGEVDDLDVTRPELFDYRRAARQLERVADHAVRIGRVAERVEPDATALDDVASLGEEASAVVETGATALLESSSDRAHEALDCRDAVVDDARGLDRRLFGRSSPGAYALSQVLESLVRTAECGGNLASVALGARARPSPG